jgi:hypothetical protein
LASLVSGFRRANQAPERAGANWFLFFELPRGAQRHGAEFRRSRVAAGDSFRKAAATATVAILLACCAALLSCAGMGGPATAAPAPPPETPHDAVVRIAAAIRRAAYADDREKLKSLLEEMAPFAGEGESDAVLRSRAHYWRGFGLWRHAWNGIAEGDAGGMEWAEIEEGLRGAVEEFDQSATLDPQFVEAAIARLACLESLAVTLPAAERPREYKRLWDLLAELQKAAPQNPRVAWVLGTVMRDTPVKQGGGPEKSVATFRDGLDWARKQTIADAADPAWGEAELLLGLTLARLNAKPPNPDAADHYAHAALNIEPNWRYVKDILLPQIQAARDKANAPPAKPRP